MTLSMTALYCHLKAESSPPFRMILLQVAISALKMRDWAKKNSTRPWRMLMSQTNIPITDMVEPFSAWKNMIADTKPMRLV